MTFDRLSRGLAAPVMSTEADVSETGGIEAILTTFGINILVMSGFVAVFSYAKAKYKKIYYPRARFEP